MKDYKFGDLEKTPFFKRVKEVRKNMTKRKAFLFLSLFFILIVLPLLIFSLQHRQNLKQKADVGNTSAFTYDYDKKFYIMVGIDSYLSVPFLQTIKPTLGEDGKYIKIGIAGHVNYMRTTTGRANDWHFDRYFDPNLVPPNADPNERVSTGILETQIQQSIQSGLPIYFALNGETWGDAGSDVPVWDLNDYLQMPDPSKSLNDPVNTAHVQLQQDGLSVLDDYNNQRPRLGRALTLSVFDTTVRNYKKRNLQEAVREILNFANQYPYLFLGVSIDSDIVQGGWGASGYYDYNAQSIVQFRHWLLCNDNDSWLYKAGGPYYAYRRQPCLTLEEVNRNFGKNFTSWHHVDPPRPLPYTANDNDPWWQEWTRFRQHQVDLRVEETIQWVIEAGMPADKVFPHNPIDWDTTERVTDFYSGGQLFNVHAGTLQAANVANAFGTDMYGPGALNIKYKYDDRPFFSHIKKMNSNWGNFEYNPAILNPAAAPSPYNTIPPNTPATYEQAYTSLREHFNYGAHIIVPMTWQGGECGTSGFLHWGSIRGCPFEAALRDFISQYKDIPRGVLAWEFGMGAQTTLEKWRPLNNLQEISKQDGILKLRYTGGDPFFESPDYLTYFSTGTDKVKFRMRASGGGNSAGQIYWITEDDNGWGNNGKMASFTFIGDGQWREYAIDVPWSGEIRQFRIDPGSGESVVNQELEIDWIRLGRSNLVDPIPSLTPTRIPTPTRITTPTPTPTTPAKTITVYAEGTPVGGGYPSMELVLSGVSVLTFENVTAGVKAYSYPYTGTVVPSQVQVSFINDDGTATEDRNLRVDRIVINGVTYHSESPYTRNTSCYPGTDWLFCNGSFIYSANSTFLPSPTPTRTPTSTPTRTPTPTRLPTPTVTKIPTPTSPPLPAPTNLRVSCDSTGTKATFRWTGVSSATGYRIRLYKAPKNDWFNPVGGDQYIVITNGDILSYTAFVMPNSEYTMFSVQAVKPGIVGLTGVYQTPFSCTRISTLPTPTPVDIRPLCSSLVVRSATTEITATTPISLRAVANTSMIKGFTLAMYNLDNSSKPIQFVKGTNFVRLDGYSYYPLRSELSTGVSYAIMDKPDLNWVVGGIAQKPKRVKVVATFIDDQGNKSVTDPKCTTSFTIAR